MFFSQLSPLAVVPVAAGEEMLSRPFHQQCWIITFSHFLPLFPLHSFLPPPNLRLSLCTYIHGLWCFYSIHVRHSGIFFNWKEAQRNKVRGIRGITLISRSTNLVQILLGLSKRMCVSTVRWPLWLRIPFISSSVYQLQVSFKWTGTCAQRFQLW